MYHKSAKNCSTELVFLHFTAFNIHPVNKRDEFSDIIDILHNINLALLFVGNITE